MNAIHDKLARAENTLKDKLASLDRARATYESGAGKAYQELVARQSDLQSKEKNSRSTPTLARA